MYREYHIDTHEFLQPFIKNKTMSGDLSVRTDKKDNTLIHFVQDESVFHQFQFTTKFWKVSKGESTLLPKSQGYMRMVSTYASRPFGLALINKTR